MTFWGKSFLINSVSALTLLMGSAACAENAQNSATDAQTVKERLGKGGAITVTGKAKNVGADNFTLDYGDGDIVVEVDDWDWFTEAALIGDGDTVTVYGIVDDDLFERRTIEAGSVFLQNRGEFVFANAADEEDFYFTSPYFISVETPLGVTTYGDVTAIEGREFVLDAGGFGVRVDTIHMAYNPLDDEGYQQIEVGDRVSVAGDINDSFFDDTMIDANSIVIVSESGKSDQSDS